jgi:nucleoside-diphosphate-sugar epimerase
VVYGTRTDEIAESGLATRFDFDAVFGTAINRFVAQAVIGAPITPYGHGGQARGFLPLRDSVQCMTLAIENPPAPGEYRVFNQLEAVYGIKELAETVYQAAKGMGLTPKIKYIKNPRVEAEDHYYNPDHQHLLDLGYKPTANMQDELKFMFEDLLPHRERIVRSVINPQIKWK